MEKLTKRQSEILALIKTYIEESGMPPTRMEIAGTFGFRSPNAAEEHLRTLARKGYIEMLPGASRGIRLIGQDDDPEPGLPIIGQVAAGQPVLAQENVLGHCDVNPDFFKPRADYFLRVKGLSMMDAGILEGDLLAVHKTADAQRGQVVVARIGDEVTVKRFDRKRNKIILLPENQDFEPIEVDSRSDDFAIEGLAVGVIRDGI
ncbi:MAG: repressor LexA [Pseudomonadales bacterium]|jgi:repressor LexA|nr:repressor LexA [Pseudomonadales bacterium]MCK5791536.1 transcriptional repressor LexA [Ketobacter sp.]MEC8810741.1 transcriptional repressor LexA [Pseudomonadota bacterium]TNC90706.1 MAG: repressor LexA [Alcanivorax sp.]HAG96837.1 repressor LexA [Gammaproteobacteria bacterium]|tara:strand:+ start:13618 stop:14229 length:612 start_codon:yes stop_codon:yes gene_type:complete